MSSTCVPVCALTGTAAETKKQRENPQCSAEEELMWEQAVEWDGKGEILQARPPLPPSIPILHPPPRAQPSSVGLGEAGQAGQGASAPSTSLGKNWFC